MREFILKEFYKVKLPLLVFIVASIFCIAWIYFDIKSGINKYTVSFYTLQVMFNKRFSYNHLDELNILFAVILGFCSMFYERQNARIRVQFHYPHTYTKNALTITLIPLCFLLAVYISELVSVFFIFNSIFAIEITLALLSTLFYSAMFGVGLFLATQSIVIEPNLKRVFSIIFIVVASLYLYFKINPDVGNSSLYYLNDMLYAYLSLWIIFCVSSLILSLNNYKKGYIK